MNSINNLLDFFNISFFQHHCRNCGCVVCGQCSSQKFLMPAQSSKPLRVCDPCYANLSKTDSPTVTLPESDAVTNMVQGKPRPLRPCTRPLSTVQEMPETPPPSETPPPRPPPPILFPVPRTSFKDDLKDIPEIPKDEVQINIPARPPKLYELVQLSHDDQESFDMDDGQTASVFCGPLRPWIQSP